MYFSCKNYVIKLNTTKLILFTKKKKLIVLKMFMKSNNQARIHPVWESEYI